MTLTWGQLCIVGIGAFAFCCLIFGFAVIAYTDICDPEAGLHFDADLEVDDPIGEDFAAWAVVLHHTTQQNGPDRAA